MFIWIFADKRSDCFTVDYWLKELFNASADNLTSNAKTAYSRIKEISKMAEDARHCIIAHTSRAALYKNNPLSPMPNGANDFETYYQSMEVFANAIAAKIGNGMTIRYEFIPVQNLPNPGEEVVNLLKLGMAKRKEQFSRRTA